MSVPEDHLLTQGLIGSWLLPHADGYTCTITFKAGGNFSYVIAVRSWAQKLWNFVEGNEYRGDWHVHSGCLVLNYNDLPESNLNFTIPLIDVKLSLANIGNSIVSWFREPQHQITYFDRDSLRLIRHGKEETWHRVG